MRTAHRIGAFAGGGLPAAASVLARPAWRGGDREVRGDAALQAMLAAGAIGSFLVAVALAPRRMGGVRLMWWVSWSLVAVCALGMVVAWVVINRDPGHHLTAGTAVRSDADVGRYLSEQGLPAATVRVPTGLFVQSIEFTNGNNVLVSGYVWQRFAAAVPRTVSRGVVLPEAGDAYAATEVYRRTDAGGTETIGWYIEATLRQKFDYRAYPLDRQNVWLRLWQPDFDVDAVLVPDFSAYPPWLARGMLGTDPEMVTGEWLPQYTTYSYLRHRYTTSFGLARYTQPVSYPDMYFNMIFSRDYRGPTLAKLIPGVLIALIVFSSLFITTRDERTMAVAGFNSFAVVAFTVTMLIAVVVDHNAVRELATDGSVLYLEYVYFAIYAMILLVTVNGVLMAWDPPPRFLTWEDNALPRLAYWPLMLGFLFAVTLVLFF
ncbi:hypothetical protein K1W54_16085 [Micromonospora sp. CPCC 205371]|nr:hypothetical protein [Micromonospora sp. CPCC 205371]